MMISTQQLSDHIAQALLEDVGDGDITAGLVDPGVSASATIITRESGVLCGVDFANETFRQVDSACNLTWKAADGDEIAADQVLCHLSGPRERCSRQNARRSIFCSCYQAPQHCKPLRCPRCPHQS